ncbi:DUF5682 family protein [Nonomuraea soli]
MHVLGVRHHGPGSARAVRTELERLRPDVILIEGPPEADPLVPLLPALDPPVALLAHVPGDATRAAFWPFAAFSPEWQAMAYGTANGVSVRFCDLPAAHTLAAPGERADELSVDPIGTLAAAAGYDDPERWWEDVVEHRGDTPFTVVAEAMAAVREGHEPGEREARREAYMRRTLRAATKEGFERIAVVCGAWHVPALTGPLPSAQSDNALLRGMAKVRTELTWVPWTYGRLASWSGYGAGITSPGWYHHLFTVPDRPIERWLAGVAALLRAEGLGVSSAHVIEGVRLAHGLAALRGRPLAGLGEVTEAARAVLCEGDELPLELVRERLVVGDRIGVVGDGVPMVPLQRDLREQQRRLRLRAEAGEREIDLDLRKGLDLGRSRLLHRLGLLEVEWGVRREARGRGTFRETWALGWRPEFDLRLIEAAALGVTVEAAATQRVRDLASGARTPDGRAVGSSPGGPSTGGPGGQGTRGPGGQGTPSAAGPSGGGPSLAELAGLVEACLVAELPGALPEVLAALSARSALDTDVTHLMAALPAMVRAQRYGDVRGTSAEGLAGIVRSMLERICVGLPVAAGGLDDDAAAALLRHVDRVHGAVALLTDTTRPPAPPTAPDVEPGVGSDVGQGIGQEIAPGVGPGAGGEGVPGATPGSRWLMTLRGMCDRRDLHGLIEGRLTRILLDAGELGDVEARMARATSRGHAPARVAAWVEGFLAGGGLLLVHDPKLLALLDSWLAALDAGQFVEVLPLLRRTFGTFAAPERRAIGERVKGERHQGADAEELDDDRAAAAVRTVRMILGRGDA